MSTARELRTVSKSELRDAILDGHPVAPSDIEGWVYRGTSLALPSLIERLTWKTFQKTFWRAPASGRLLGWNVRLHQDGIDAPSRPKTKNGRPVTEWNYEVVAPGGVPMPRGFDRGLVIDYSLAPNPPGPVHFSKDPLVALSPGSADELLGVTYLVLGGRTVETPTYFTLVREHPIADIPDDLRALLRARAGVTARARRAAARPAGDAACVPRARVAASAADRRPGRTREPPASSAPSKR